MTTARAPRQMSFWPLNLIGWAAFGVSMSLSRIGRFPMDYMVASKFVMAALAFLISGFVLRPLYRRALGQDATLARTITVTVVASYVGAAAWTALHSLIDIGLVQTFLNPSAQIRGFWGLFGGTLYDAFAMLAWSVMYVAVRHQRDLQAERERALRAEALANQAQLDALRWQLNPHFLFNALNAISTLVIDNRGREATSMIARLGDLLRSTLEVQGGTDISLRDEIELVQRYLDIEKVRLGDKLSLQLSVEEDTWKARVLPMMLQPLVENAIRHGIAARDEQGVLRISARRLGERLEIAVEDNGPGLGATGSNGSGIGLANTRQRLQHLYGDAHRFVVRNGESGGVCAEVSIPFREQ